MEQLFQPMEEFPILLCKNCECAVRSTQIIAHLRQPPHRIPQATAQQIQSTVLVQWPQISQTLDLNLFLNTVREPIAGLTLFTDGIQCRRGSCSYIGRTINTITEHWRNQHRWSANLTSTPSESQREPSSTYDELTRYTSRVHCQRLYRQGTGSQYFAVSGVVREPSPTPDPLLTDSLFDHLETQFQSTLDPIHQRIQPAEINEANPWLRRTKWDFYLREQQPQKLLDLIRLPESSDTSSTPITILIQTMAGIS